MSGDLKAFLIGWGILIAFLVIRYLVRSNNFSKLSNRARVIDEIKSSRSLYFKGSQEAFEYIQKFIETLPLKKGGAYYGILGANGSMARVHCKFKGKVQTMMVSVRGKKCNNELKMDDLVLVGVDDVRKGLTLKKALEYTKLKDNSKKSVLGALHKMESESSIGNVLKIVKPEMNSKTMKFDIYDE
ncbi:hypothetical protein N9L95_02210 [Candidatus Pelagibacter bacterium]|jgi:hypothetical protein|nr:hypothetical protein [Candidatus Pelagibacter bacterium]